MHLTESMINMELIRFLYCCFAFLLLYCHCCLVLFFNWLLGRVLVLKLQSYSSQSTPFTPDEISEAGIAVRTPLSASVGCLLKLRWAPKCYLLFSFLIFLCTTRFHVFSFEAYAAYCFCVAWIPLLVLLAFNISFSFPPLFKLFLSNSSELRAEETWLDSKLSKAKN